MSSILEQIQSLTDKFNNLFEVEGLGEPASDVPPSTNKIKKDRKTKDGKVEIVSVEDELFPKEGNAKEQFRQKVIDKINGMIQGTATLEDLLQLVRSKQVKPVKEGFEGAIELAEDLYNYIKKKHGEPKYAGIDSHPANKSAELIHKMSDAKGKEYAEEKEKNPDVNLYNKRCTTKNTRGEQKTQNRSSEYRKFSDDWRLPKTDDEKITASIRRNKLKPAKEAQEILEEIINEVSVGALARATENNVKRRQEAHRKSTEALKKAHDNYEEQSKKHPEDESALYNALDKLSSATRKEGEKASHANDLANLNLPKDSKVSANKLFDKADKTYAKRGKEVDKALDKGKGRGDKEFDTPMKKYSRAVDLAVADPVVSRRTNGGANESFEGAIEILEEIINEVSSTTMRNALHAHNERKRELEDRANKRIGEIFKKNGIKGNTYGATTPNDIERAVRTEKEIQNDSEMKNIQKEQEKRARKNKLYVDALDKIHRAKLAEAQELSELFDRPDLLDDILKTTTGKGTKQHLQNLGKKLLGLDKKKVKKEKACESFDSLEENSYNIIRILEEIINEVSNGKIKDSVTDRENLIDGAKELKNLVRTDVDKKLIDDAIIRDQHRVEVVKDKLENRIVDKAKAEHEEGKKKKKKERE